MFQMITASFLAVAEIADVLPLRKAMRLKKLESAVSFRLPTALAACLNAILTNVSQVVDTQLQTEVVRCDFKLMN